MEFPLEGLTGRPIGYEDATWILTSAFIIFTMQSGFGLIESGWLFLIKQMKLIKMSESASQTYPVPEIKQYYKLE